MSVPIWAPASLRTITVALIAKAVMLASATPVVNAPVLSNGRE